MFYECRHIKTNGLRCHAAALSGRAYCYFHFNLHRLHKAPVTHRFNIPPLEDSSSVLLGITHVLRALDSSFVDRHHAQIAISGLRIAAQIIARQEQAENQPRPSEFVRDLSAPSGDPVDIDSPETWNDGADILAPEKLVCEPPHDCLDCPRNDDCISRRDLYEDKEQFGQPIEQEEEEDDDETDAEVEETGEDQQDQQDDKQQDKSNEASSGNKPRNHNDSRKAEEALELRDAKDNALASAQDEDDTDDPEDHDSEEGEEEQELDLNDPVVKAALRILRKDSPRPTATPDH
jgi:hypothetical protein